MSLSLRSRLAIMAVALSTTVMPARADFWSDAGAPYKGVDHPRRF